MSAPLITASLEALGKALHPHVCPKNVSDDHFDVIEKPGIVMLPYCYVVADSLPVVAADALADDEELISDLDSRAGWGYGTRDALETLATALADRNQS